MNNLFIIREVTPNRSKGRHCVIRTRRYGSNLAYINLLVAEARKDFPELQDSDIEIKHYAGQYYKRTFGIEFIAPRNCDVPDTYKPISELEQTF